jgi:hypothetical protein
MWLLYPLFNQLGHWCKCRIYLPRIFKWTKAWSGCTSLARNALALGGGIQGSPAKQYFATSASS